MKALPAIIATALWPLASGAAVIVTSQSFAIGAEVPDNSAVGFSDTRVLDSTIESITHVSVGLTLSGGWAGDIYAYLVHGSGYSVLLNRPGRTLAQPEGSGANRIDVTFTDDSLADIHQAIASAGVISGSFQPDARHIDPAEVWETTPRSAFLSDFEGLDANGGWTLFLADMAAGDTMVLESWTLTVTGTPEPSTAVLACVGLPLLLNRRRARGNGASGRPLGA